MRLALTVPHCAGESATSLFSRLAARNMCLSARHFGRDMDLPFQDVINGMPEAIACQVWSFQAESTECSFSIRRPGITRKSRLLHAHFEVAFQFPARSSTRRAICGDHQRFLPELAFRDLRPVVQKMQL